MQQVIAALCESGAPFLIIGGHGLSLHGVQRDTVDVDCMIAAENTDRFADHLRRQGFEEMARQRTFTRFRHRSLLFPPLDVMEVNAQTWAKVYGGSEEGILFGKLVRVPSVPHYVALKLHALKQNPDRETKDVLDIVALVSANPDAAPAQELEDLCTRYAPAGFWAKLRKQLSL